MQPSKVVTETIEYFPAKALAELMIQITASKATGSLTINFSCGSPSGTCDWRQKVTVVPDKA